MPQTTKMTSCVSRPCSYFVFRHLVKTKGFSTDKQVLNVSELNQKWHSEIVNLRVHLCVLNRPLVLFHALRTTDCVGLRLCQVHESFGTENLYHGRAEQSMSTATFLILELILDSKRTTAKHTSNEVLLHTTDSLHIRNRGIHNHQGARVQSACFKWIFE